MFGGNWLRKYGMVKFVRASILPKRKFLVGVAGPTIHSFVQPCKNNWNGTSEHRSNQPDGKMVQSGRKNVQWVGKRWIRLKRQCFIRLRQGVSSMPFGVVLSKFLIFTIAFASFAIAKSTFEWKEKTAPRSLLLALICFLPSSFFLPSFFPKPSTPK